VCVKTKMFHVKHFGTIGGREKLTLAGAALDLLGEIFCPVRQESAWRDLSRASDAIRSGARSRARGG
jgi:hypothetical protein